MEQNRVSPLLAYVVQTQVAQRMGAREHVRQNDVKALQCISPALLKSLAFAVHRKAHVRPLAVDLAAWTC